MKTTTDDSVLRITFDRPDAMNAFNDEEAVALAEVVAEADPETHDAIVLTGEGEAFSAGGDIEAMAERDERPREAYDRYNRTYGRVAEELFTCPVPVVASINGDAVGAGLTLTALSDFAYAVEDATFGCAFVHVGLIPDTGGSYLLPRLIGLRAAKRLAFTGAYFDASEAAELGLITAAVTTDELDERVSSLVETLRDRPTETIGFAKQAIHDNLGRGFEDALDHEAMLQTQAYNSEAHEDGVAAFLERGDE
ncbi:enoyl-CoA hydratase/isomerase family protein [Halovenus salina]|uniref:Enoyl-CoA hydratase/isomerase family protein n=1 Tax=Halovenus salina TaxID=1510225 RepID=A0ABD5W823_9EURY|nr:enoyl-CoA hydratase-related protein [Halovenus salina]